MSPPEPRTLEIEGTEFIFLLRRSARRTLGISVEPDQQVVVTAPAEASEDTISAALRRRMGWIRKKQRAFENLPPPPVPRLWVAGETHRYLGRQYRLKLVEGAPVSVRLAGSYFVVTVNQPANRSTVQNAMELWYREHAKTLLTARVTRALRSTTWLDLENRPPVIVRSMRQRWGSTTPSGRVYFNLDLVKLPIGCVDYVVMHELVHLKIPHHGAAFWRLLSRCMPDWGKWRMRLDKTEI